MADSVVVEYVVGELERATPLGRPAVRALVRGALERGRFDAASVSSVQMRLLVERLLVPELQRAGVTDAERICRQIHTGLGAPTLAWDGPESPDEIFSRMIRRR
jgi:hypothetical protein